MEYKLSNYNYYINYHNRVIYCNGLSGSIISFSQEENKFIQQLFKDLSFFAINYQQLFQNFKQFGFIIDKNINEIDKILFENRKKIFLDKQYRITIFPTLECNFNCWYCYEQHPKGYMKNEIQEKIKKHIQLINKNYDISSLLSCWFGGEPLLYFNEVVFPLSKFFISEMKFLNKPFDNQITTNGYLINDEMIEKFIEINMHLFQITLDGDDNFHNKVRNHYGKNSYEKIIKNIHKLLDKIQEPFIVVRFNYTDENLKSFLKVLDDLPIKHNKYILIDFQRIWQTINYKCKNNDINEDLLEIIEKCIHLGFYPRYGNFHPAKFHACYADRLHSIEIDVDGNVYRCTARDLNKSQQAGELLDNGLINWKEDKMYKIFSRATFENSLCLNCKHLPLCTGPCHQKLLDFGGKDLSKICMNNVNELSMEINIIKEYEKMLKEFNREDMIIKKYSNLT